MYICLCKSVRLSDAVERAKDRGCTPEAVTETWGLDEDDACGRCLENIEVVSWMVEHGLKDQQSRETSLPNSR